MSRITDVIKSMFLRAVLVDMEEEREGIHVSHLVSPCLRNSWYSIRYGGQLVTEDGETVGGLSETSMITLWLGKKLHETPFSNVVINGKSGHEFTMNWMDVTGTADEIVMVDNEIIIVDKKTVNEIPRRAYDRHMNQIKYYALMLYKLYGIRVNRGVVLYIKKALHMNDMVAVQPFEFLIGDLGEIENDFVSRVFALKDDVPPEPIRGNHCAFCKWQEICARETGKVDIVELNLEGGE